MTALIALLAIGSACTVIAMTFMCMAAGSREDDFIESLSDPEISVFHEDGNA